MLFNFFLGNQSREALNWLGDVLTPIYAGLRENGHHVIGFGVSVMSPPAINVFVEGFESDPFVDAILQAKTAGGQAGPAFGILCVDDLATLPADSRRAQNLRRIAAHAEFVWTILPQADFLARLCDPARVEFVEFGYSELCRDPYATSAAARKDVDALLYGDDTPYRAAVMDSLKARNLVCFTSNREAWPSFMMDDIIRRSKVLLDLRRTPAARFLSPVRIAKGLHGGALVLSERFDESPLAALYAFTEHRQYAELAPHCLELIASGAYAELAQLHLTRFRGQTSMRQNIARVLSAPVFARFS